MATRLPRRPKAGGVFVGRAWELEQLRAALSDAQHGRGALFVITGDAGIGKTRLAGEFAAHAETEEAQVLWGRCWEGEEAPAFWPWVQIFRTLGFAAEPSAEILGVQPSNAARFRLFDTAVMAIGEAAAARPLVLILEDLHEADRSSLLLLDYLVRHLQGMAVLLLATCREPEPGLALAETLSSVGPRAHLVTLGGLRREEVAEFLGRGFGAVLPEETLAAVHEGTGGNPFFLDDLARRFVGEGRFARAPGGGLEVPEGLKGPVRSRVAPISADARVVLALAAVVGREFSFDVLVSASGLTDAQAHAALNELTAARLVEPAGFGLGPHRFVHALVRETIYQDLPVAERCRLHGTVARAIESRHSSCLDRHLDHLAYHFSQAAALGDTGPAIRYSRRAGERAARQLGYDEAVAHFRRAHDMAQAAGAPPEERFDILVALGDAQWWAGYVTHASETFIEGASLAREAGDTHWLAEAALRVGEVGYGGAYAQAWWFDEGKVRILDEALKALGDEETTLAVRVAARLSTALYFSPFESLARRDLLSRRAVALARQLGEASALGYALNARHLAVWEPDNLDERLTLAGEIVELARASGDAFLELTGRVWLLADRLEMGDVAGADGEVDTYVGLAEHVGYPQFEAYASMFRALQAIMRGDFQDAELLAERSRAIGEQVGDANIALSYHVQLATLRVLQGRPAEAAGHLDHIAREHPPQLGRIVTLAFRWIAGERALGPGAFRSVARARSDIPPAFLLSLGSALALLAADADASDEAVELYDLLHPYEHRWALAGRDAVVAMWPLAYPLGVLAAHLSRFDAAAGHFEAAIEAAERAGCRPSVALAKAGYGAMLARSCGSAGRSRAIRLLDEALEAATELGMRQVREQALAASALLSASGAQDERGQAPPEGPGEAVFRLEGDFWSISYAGVLVRMKDAKGFGYLRRLLAAPGRELHVLDLAAGASGHSAGTGVAELRPVDWSDGDPVLDARAKAAFRARIEELSRDRDEAESEHDLERASRARAEIDLLVEELSRAVGLGGRDRPAAGSPAERARSSVGKSLRSCLRRIEDAHPALGAHLATTVRTGYFCSYNPDPRVRIVWTT
ncbi:MAG: ATP-binding protein [Actinomycetota bacterium]